MERYLNYLAVVRLIIVVILCRKGFVYLLCIVMLMISKYWKRGLFGNNFSKQPCVAKLLMESTHL